MKLLMVASEAVPYIKTGGLGDIVGTLARILSSKGHEVLLVIPLYRQIMEAFPNMERFVQPLSVELGDSSPRCSVFRISPLKRLTVCFIEYNHFFNRSGLYDDGGKAYHDNGPRFAFLSKAALDLARLIDFRPDIAHVHDWQTGLVAYYLKTWDWGGHFFRDTASVLTIHNMGYQGETDLKHSAFIGLNWMQMRKDEFEAFGSINLLKGSFFYSDHITTVSPTYAKEILSEPGGCGLSPYLRRRAADISGILNGIDTEEWNPKTDRFIPATYSVNQMRGKAVCKTELQKYYALEVNPDIPVLCVVGRLAYQKGLDLLIGCLPEILKWELQFVILGSGESRYSDFFRQLPGEYPSRVGSYIGFDNRLAHLMEAGSDFFVMPSLYEPCGLNQMFSSLYGSIPIVRATGGLSDTVENLDETTGSGTGFVFNDATSDALKNTIGWALSIWYNKKKVYRSMRKRGMEKDFSWKNALRQYENVFHNAISRKRLWN